MITVNDIRKMPYVEFMAFLEETNRPPGGKDSLRKVVQNTFITNKSKVLDVGCNTGYCSFEIAHLTKSQVIGIDINRKMVQVAKKELKKDLPEYQKMISFKIADARNMSFKDEEYNLVLCGGSTAFIEDKKRALEEYKRVCKKWGFIADINFYFHTKPPSNLIQQLNDLMNIRIKPWGIDYWINLYESVGLEKYYIYKKKLKRIKEKRVKEYCRYMIKRKNLGSKITEAAYKKLLSIMKLFNWEHEYLAYGVFIYRKRACQEEKSLFIA